MTARGLSGFTIGVTADRRAAEQALLFERQGATVLHGATLRAVPELDDEALLAVSAQLIEDPPDLLVLLSGFGVECWTEAIDAAGLHSELHRSLAGVRTWSRGRKPLAAAMNAQLEVHRSFGCQDDLLEALGSEVASGWKVAVVVDGSADVAPLLKACPDDVELRSVVAYRYADPLDNEPAHRLVRSLVDGQVDALTFTSRPSVDRFIDLAHGDGLLDQTLDALRGRCVAICVGPLAAGALEELGVPTLVPEHSRLGLLVHAASAHLGARVGRYEVEGTRFSVRGRLICVEGAELVLSDRERDLLDALRDQRGRVLSKGELLRDVWQGDSDPHVVEVNVARLRRRLGSASDAIETVYRRGYRWAASEDRR